MTPETDPAWKVRLRYGKLKTNFHHYSLIADGEAVELEDVFECKPGPAVMGMKVWASSSGEAMDMISAISKQLGFNITGRIYVYDTEPAQPPQDCPHGYDINFTAYDR